METDYKYQAEYAKSNRSSCRSCKNTISMGSLRMGTLVQSHTFDGKMTLWFHYSCFFKKSKVLQTADIKNFDGLKFEDQEKIRAEINSEKFDLTNFGVKPNADLSNKCSYCSKMIKDPFFVDGKSRELGTSYHAKCFMKKYPGTEFSKISGLSKLKAQEKFDLLDAVANVRPPSKKRGAEDSENSENVAPSKKSKLSKTTDDSTKEALRKQSEKLWHLRSKLEAEVSKNALIGLLEFNDQHVPTGLASLLDAVVDGMLFGALLPCPECKSGALTYENGSYRCKGMASQWARCTYSTMEPKRRAFKVPKQYHDVELLRTYKYKPRVRLFAGDAATGGGQFDKKAPLAGLHFLLDRGPFHNDLTQRDLAASIKKLGGSLLATVTRGGVFVTTPVEDTETKLAARARGLAMRPLCSTYLDKLAKAKTSAEVQQLIDQNPMAAAWRDADSSAVCDFGVVRFDCNAAGRNRAGDGEDAREGRSRGRSRLGIGRSRERCQGRRRSTALRRPRYGGSGEGLQLLLPVASSTLRREPPEALVVSIVGPHWHRHRRQQGGAIPQCPRRAEFVQGPLRGEDWKRLGHDQAGLQEGALPLLPSRDGLR
uniref:NAD(+) ADP-ribosyltransferase n=1 Tax=Mesocestoides corti TaxID=53468 RepID=A0A5K3FCR6_MESCO